MNGASLPSFGDRWQATEILKPGPLVHTYLGVDERDGDPVVIKATAYDHVEPSVRMRLEHEAHLLRQLEDDQLAAPLALGRHNDALYLVKRYVPGVPLSDRLLEGPLGTTDTLVVGRGILTALRRAHAHQVLHRDIKPANVIVGGGDALAEATLIDFGLARSMWLHPALQDQPVGTARYVSPEQAGLLDNEVGEASDLYSTGIVLFECLAGEPPFGGATVGEVLRRHLTEPAPELRSLGLEVPRVLDEVIRRLLRKDPRDRYQSAEAVLADLDEIAAALEGGVDEPSLVVGRHDVRRSLTEPAFVGRAEELDALDAKVRASAGGETGLAIVEAPSGGGKTRLLEELAQRSAQGGAWVLRGQGLDQAAPHPFQMLAGVAAGIVGAAARDPERIERLKERLGDQRTAVCAAIPELAGPLAFEAAEELGPEAFGEARALDALSALLDALGEPRTPAVVLLDDCQWADELTVRLLAHWRRQPRQAVSNVLLVAAFRSEEVGPDDPLRALGADPHVTLSAFGGDDFALLLESMAGELPPDAVDIVARLSEGNPFMASAVLRGLVESGALVDAQDGWRVEPLAMASVQSSRQAAVFLTRRLELLPAPVLELLSVGAVLGKAWDLDLAAELARQAPEQAHAGVGEARRRHIIWLTADGRCTFVHDKLRESLLERLPTAQRRELHLDAAARLEADAPDRVFELAYHFDAAGDPTRALPYALAAADAARGRHALDVAETQYRIAASGASAESAEMRARIAEGLGDVLMLRGRYDLAAEQLADARRLTGGGVPEAQIEGKLGELAFKRGDMPAAAASTEEALRLLGHRIPRRDAGYFVQAVREIVFQTLHSLLPRFFLARRPLDDKRAERELLAVRLYSTLAHVYWFQKGKFPCLWTHLRGFNLAERYPPTPGLANAYSEHAPVMTMVPWFSRGIDYALRSLRIRQELGDLWGQGQSLHFYGVVLYGSSRYRECIEHCREAVRLLERTGDRWEINTASWHIAFSLYRLGQLADAADKAQEVYRAGLDIGDPQATGISLGAWAKASAGGVPAEAIATERARPKEDVHTSAEVLQAEAVRLIGASRPLEAVAPLEEALALVRERGLEQEYVSPISPWLATALREAAEELPAYAAGHRADLLKRARKASRDALRTAGRYRNNLPHALREAGLLAAAAGRTRKARRLLDRSAEEARRQEARYELARTLLARGRVGVESGWRGANEDVAEGEQELTALAEELEARGHAAVRRNGDLGPAPEPVTLSLADRFNTVLDAGRQIASALNSDAIFAAVREGGSTILRGERCQILRVTADGEDVTLASDELDTELDELGRSLAQEAIGQVRPVVFSRQRAPDDDSTSESLSLSGVRSAICAPIQARGAVVACLYVYHRGVDALFGAEEERLAEYLATLAGAALENAEGFAEVEALTHTLERRVEERTRDLEHQAFHDALTDLANRGLFSDRVEHALARAARRGGELAVLFLDLDDFKTVNDSLGHAVGDQLLIAVADRLRRSLRAADTAARLGGDEFGVLIEDLEGVKDAELCAARIIEALAAPFTLDGREMFVHGSVGIAIGGADVQHGEPGAMELLRNADVAMYVAKNRGKRRFELFQPNMHTGVVERLELKADLQRALDRNDFVLHYQPIVDLNSQRVRGVEALVRWRHPERGIVPPADFVPLAEETGLIRPMGHWVLHEACRQAGAWSQDASWGDLTLSVNLSARQLQEPELVDQVAGALAEHELDASKLVIEITESVLAQDTEATINRLRALKRLGVGLAIDDFGTGYSSLGYLKRFPLDMVKIAKPFVDDVDGSEEDAVLAGAIVGLGATFRLRIVAEGIERLAQLRRLRSLGCAEGQGFLFSRPVTADRMAELLDEGLPLGPG